MRVVYFPTTVNSLPPNSLSIAMGSFIDPLYSRLLYSCTVSFYTTTNSPSPNQVGCDPFPKTTVLKEANFITANYLVFEIAT